MGVGKTPVYTARVRIRGMKQLKVVSVGLMTIIAIASCSLRAPKVDAQSSELQISPVKSIISANPGDKKQVVISVKNTLQATRNFNAIFRNFTAGEAETGDPRVVDDPGLAHGIQKWLSGPESIPINSGSTRDSAFTISVPAGTPTGTYYGLVLFSKQSNSPNEGISASVGSYVFVNVGPITQEVAIEEFNTAGIAVSPSGMAEGKFVVRLKNTGNGYTVPNIKIEILDDNKSVIQTIDVNEASGGILPESIRKYTADFSRQLEPPRSYSARLTTTTEKGESVTAERVLVEVPSITVAGTKSQPPKSKKTFVIVGLAVGILLVALTGVLIARKRHRKGIVPDGTSRELTIVNSSRQPNPNSSEPPRDSQNFSQPTSPSDVSPDDRQ